jgi:signal peptidase
MKKVVSVIVNVLAWIVLIFAFLITIIVFSSGKNNGVANLFGYIPMSVETDSMKPTFASGDLIICKEIDDVKTLKENDVITFWTVINGKRAKNTHRIVEVSEDGSFITRGDNNAVDDNVPVYSSDLIGKWTEMKIPALGKFMSFLRTKTGFFIFIVIPMAIFFLIELYKFIVTLIEAKRQDVTEIDEEEIKRRAIEEYLASQKQNTENAENSTSDDKDVEKAETKAPDKAEPVAEKKEEVKEAVKSAEKTVEEAAEKTEEVKEEAVETAEEMVEEAAEKAEEVKEEVAETAEKAVEEVAEKTEEVKEEAIETAEKAVEEAAEKAEEVKEEVAETAEKAVEEVTEKAEEVKEEVAETAEKAVEEVAEKAEEIKEEAAETVEEPIEEATETADVIEEAVKSETSDKLAVNN